MGNDVAPENNIKEVKDGGDQDTTGQSAETALSQEATSQDAASIIRDNATSDTDTVANAGLPQDVELTGTVTENVDEAASGKPKADADGEVELVDPGSTSTQKHLEFRTGEEGAKPENGEGEKPENGEGEKPDNAEGGDAVDEAIKDAGKDLVDPDSTSTRKHLDFQTGEDGDRQRDASDKPADGEPQDKELQEIEANLLKIFDGKSDPQKLLEATRDLAKHSSDGNLQLRLSDNGSNSVITLQNSEIAGNRGVSNPTYKQMTHMYVSQNGGRTRVALRGVERTDNGNFDQQRDRNGNHVEYGGTGLNTMKGLVQDVDGAKVEMTTKDGRKVEATFSKNDKGEVSVEVKEIKPEPKPEQNNRNPLQELYNNPEKFVPNLTSEVDLEKPSANDVVSKAGLVSALSDLGVQSIKVTPKGQTEPITLRPVKIKGENGNPDTVYLGVDGERAFAAKLSPDGITGMDPENPYDVFDKEVYGKINGLDWEGAKVEIDYAELEDASFVVPERGSIIPQADVYKNINARLPTGELEGVRKTVNNTKAMENFMESALPGYDFPEADNVTELAQELLKEGSGFEKLDPSKGHRPQAGDLVLLAPNGKQEATKDMDGTAGFIRGDGNIVVPVGDGSKFEILGTPSQVESAGFSGVIIRANDLAKATPETNEAPEQGDKPDTGGKGNFDHLSAEEGQRRMQEAFAKFMEANKAKDTTGIQTARDAIGQASNQPLDNADTVLSLEKQLPERGFEKVDTDKAQPGDVVVMQGKPPRIDEIGSVNAKGEIQLPGRVETFEAVSQTHDLRVYRPSNLRVARDTSAEVPKENGDGIVDPGETSTQKHLDFQTGEGEDGADKPTEAELEAQRQREQQLEAFRGKGRQAMNAIFDGQQDYEAKNAILHNMYDSGLREFDISQGDGAPIKVKLEKLQKSDGEAVDPVRMSILRPGQDKWEPYLHAGGPTQDQTKYGKAYTTFDRNIMEDANVEMRFEQGIKFDFSMKQEAIPAESQSEQPKDTPQEGTTEVSDVFKAPDKAKTQEHVQDAVRSLDGIITSGRFPKYGDLDALAQSGINEVEFQNPDGSTKYALKLTHENGKYTLTNEKGEMVMVIGNDPALMGNPDSVAANYGTYQFTTLSGVKMVAKFIDGSKYIYPLDDDKGRTEPKR